MPYPRAEMKPVTARLWTRLDPWTVATSPVDGDIVEVLECSRASDAERIVSDHNMRVVNSGFWPVEERCSDCGAPFNNANAPKHGKCPACYA